MCVESTGVFIDTLVVQGTSHKHKNNKDKGDYTNKIPDKDIPKEDINHPKIKSPTEQRIHNQRPIKPRNHYGVDNYIHAQIVHCAMTKLFSKKGIR